MSEQDGLIWAYVLDGMGGGRPLDWPGIRATKGHGGLLWIHLNRLAAGSRLWLGEESGHCCPVN